MAQLDHELIASATQTLAGQIRRTPVEHSLALTEILGVPTWLKLEFFQITGSFKLRGALFRLANLSETEIQRGVATCSAGNHGKAIAHAARQLGIEVTIYVPQTVDGAKFRAMVTLGAKVIRSAFPGFDETQAWALDEIARTGQTFISAYDDPFIMAGNGGSLASEVVEDLPEARTFILPVSGGGLAAGFAYLVKARYGDAQVICCQHQGSPGLQRSLDRGEAVTQLPPIDTVAGGIEGGLGRKTFAVLQDRVDQVALVAERDIYAGVRWMLDEHQYLIEPSAAVTIAACLAGQITTPAQPTVVVLSGRNVSLATIEQILGS